MYKIYLKNSANKKNHNFDKKSTSVHKIKITFIRLLFLYCSPEIPLVSYLFSISAGIHTAVLALVGEWKAHCMMERYYTHTQTCRNINFNLLNRQMNEIPLLEGYT